MEKFSNHIGYGFGRKIDVLQTSSITTNVYEVTNKKNQKTNHAYLIFPEKNLTDEVFFRVDDVQEPLSFLNSCSYEEKQIILQFIDEIQNREDFNYRETIIDSGFYKSLFYYITAPKQCNPIMETVDQENYLSILDKIKKAFAVLEEETQEDIFHSKKITVDNIFNVLEEDSIIFRNIEVFKCLDPEGIATKEDDKKSLANIQHEILKSFEPVMSQEKLMRYALDFVEQHIQQEAIYFERFVNKLRETKNKKSFWQRLPVPSLGMTKTKTAKQSLSVPIIQSFMQTTPDENWKLSLLENAENSGLEQAWIKKLKEFIEKC